MEAHGVAGHARDAMVGIVDLVHHGVPLQTLQLYNLGEEMPDLRRGWAMHDHFGWGSAVE